MKDGAAGYTVARENGLSWKCIKTYMAYNQDVTGVAL